MAKLTKSELKKRIEEGNKLLDKVKGYKKDFKETKYRRKYDKLLKYIDVNLVNTETNSVSSLQSTSKITYAAIYKNGSYEQVPIIGGAGQNENQSLVPKFKEPTMYSKLTTAVSVLASKVPDAEFVSSDTIWARTNYELWKRTWSNVHGNGLNTLQQYYQNVLMTGAGFYRVFPKTIVTKNRGVDKILFDDIYRLNIDPRRIWVGTSFNAYDTWSYGEVLYEQDMKREDFLDAYPEAKDFNLQNTTTAEDSQLTEEQKMKFVTITYYENPLKNKYCVSSGNFVIYEGEMPNPDGFGTVVWTNCFRSTDYQNPYGVGIIELMRGNAEMYDYMNSLNAEQVEAEISPLIFAPNTGPGEMTYRRGPNVINPKQQGSQLDIVRTNGNVQQSMLYSQEQKRIISENTGINDVLAGQGTPDAVGSTVILKEAALNRLVIPRNNVISSLEQDAYITCSWIKYTYSSEKIKYFETDEEVKQFLTNNPTFFVEMLEDEKGKKKVSYSHNLEIGYDIDDTKGDDPYDHKVRELSNPYTISSVDLFKKLEEHDHLSNKLIITIDGNSMLLPSNEINKQRITELYSIVSPKTIEMMQMLNLDPNLARALMKQLEQVLRVNKEHVFEWIPKDVYDSVMGNEMQTTMPLDKNMVDSNIISRANGNVSSATGQANQQSAPENIMANANQNVFNETVQSSVQGAINGSIGKASQANY